MLPVFNVLRGPSAYRTILGHRRVKLKAAELILSPVHDFLSAMDASFQRPLLFNAVIIFMFLIISWWIYVPIHELVHAFGCMIGGGKVSRLELSPVYGAAFLKNFFPFVSVGSEYAGQLKGFNTLGSDLTYLITVPLYTNDCSWGAASKIQCL
jgi:hypothetical protein